MVLILHSDSDGDRKEYVAVYTDLQLAYTQLTGWFPKVKEVAKLESDKDMGTLYACFTFDPPIPVQYYWIIKPHVNKE
jgi:hypothetical protein